MTAINGDTAVAIDDIGAALNRMPDWGRWVLHASAQTASMAMTMCGTSRRWSLINYEAFAAWAADRVHRDHTWLILDPLLSGLGGDIHRLEVSRRASPKGWQVSVELPDSLCQELDGATVGIVDDVAASGATLLNVAAAVTAAGGTVKEFVVSAASGFSRARIREAYVDCSLERFVDGDSYAIHLRDFCPGLPRAGRLVEGIQPVRVGDIDVPVRLPPVIVRGGLWESVYQDRSVFQLGLQCRQQLIQRFTQALGREPVVADVLLLGPDVHIPLCTDVVPIAEMPLRQVLLTQ